MYSMNKVLLVGLESETGRVYIGVDENAPKHKRHLFKCTKCEDIHGGAYAAWSRPCKKCSYEKRVPLQDLRQQIYYKYKYNADLKKVPFELEFDEFCLIISQDCLYCGKPPSNIWKSHRKKENQSIYNGIDRRINSLGYTAENVSPCCKKCNIAKKAFSVDEFKKMVESWAERMDSW